MELKFRLELGKQVPTTLQLSNPTSESVAFKVKTTSPKKYCVRPNTGVVKPGETVDVLIIMQQQKEWPLDLTACKDKFLVQSLILDPRQVANVEGGRVDVATLFEDAQPSPSLASVKLRVAYTVAHAPPSPVREDAAGEQRAQAASSGSGSRIGGATSWNLMDSMEDHTAKVGASKAQSAMESLVAVQAETEHALGEVQRIKREHATLESKQHALQATLRKAAGSVQVTTHQRQAAAGYTLMHLVLVAILAFIVGRFLVDVAVPTAF